MKAQPVLVYLPDQRGVEISPFGKGNDKIGANVYTYSRIAGRGTVDGTCPGSTNECEALCYAKRIQGPVRDQYRRNGGDYVPALPADCKLLRIHVSGDFNTVPYILNWRTRLIERPDVIAWAYTRSWRVPGLLSALEELRGLPNMQLFASMDPSCTDAPPQSWRRAWLMRYDERLPVYHHEWRLDYHRTAIEKEPQPGDEFVSYKAGPLMTTVIKDKTPSLICPEETGRKPSCEACKYCFAGRKHDVTFIEHFGD